MAYGPDTEELLRRVANIQNGMLNVSYLNITSLPTLPSGLQILYCYNTPLTRLPDLPSGLQQLYCSNTHLILQRYRIESIAEYNTRWQVWREEQVTKKRCQERSSAIKENLIAEVWRPDRLQKLLETGGWDMIEAL